MHFYIRKSHIALGMLLALSIIILQLATQQAPGSASAWDSFWPSVWSGALYSLATGFFILVSFEIQRCRRELHTARSQLRSRLRHAGSLDRDTAMYCAPQGATAVCNALDSYPIDLWSERLSEHTAFIRLLQSVQARYGTFVGAASHFDRTLHDLVHEAVSNDHDDPDREAYVRRVYYRNLFAWVHSFEEGGPAFPVIAFPGINLNPVHDSPVLIQAAQGLKLGYGELSQRLDDLRQILEAN